VKPPLRSPPPPEFGKLLIGVYHLHTLFCTLSTHMVSTVYRFSKLYINDTILCINFEAFFPSTFSPQTLRLFSPQHTFFVFICFDTFYPNISSLPKNLCLNVIFSTRNLLNTFSNPASHILFPWDAHHLLKSYIMYLCTHFCFLSFSLLSAIKGSLTILFHFSH
jgi:hypothetical protein